MEIADSILVKRCLKGDKTAFGQIVDKYQNVLFNTAYRMTGNFDDAEDITQSTFIKVLEKLETFKFNHKFFSWLYRIGLNESLNFLKSRKKMEILEKNFVTKEKTPDQYYLEQEFSRDIQRAIMRLEPNQRILILLKHFNEYSYREIADILDIPEKKVKSRLFSARQILKDILIREGSQQND